MYHQFSSSRILSFSFSPSSGICILSNSLNDFQLFPSSVFLSRPLSSSTCSCSHFKYPYLIHFPPSLLSVSHFKYSYLVYFPPSLPSLFHFLHSYLIHSHISFTSTLRISSTSRFFSVHSHPCPLYSPCLHLPSFSFHFSEVPSVSLIFYYFSLIFRITSYYDFLVFYLSQFLLLLDLLFLLTFSPTITRKNITFFRISLYSFSQNSRRFSRSLFLPSLVPSPKILLFLIPHFSHSLTSP